MNTAFSSSLTGLNPALMQAQALLQANDFSGAMALIEEAYQADMKDYHIPYFAIQMLQPRGDQNGMLMWTERALKINPKDYSMLLIQARVYNTLFNVHGMAHQKQAIKAYQSLRKHHPQDGEATHMLAAIQGKNIPTANQRYVQQHFDGFANKFGAYVTTHLNYRVPEDLKTLWLAQNPTKTKALTILDVGCGDGLAAPHFAPHAAEFIGADLSPKMVAEAEKCGKYTELFAEDITYATKRYTDEQDMILAADVFIYVGALETYFRAAANALKTGGSFLFSTENQENNTQTFHLKPSGRFGHSSAYIEKLAEQNGFHIQAKQPTTIRVESGQPLAGMLWVLMKK